MRMKYSYANSLTKFMAFTSEDLENNSFYTELETKFSEKYREAQKKLWIICVPCENSLKGTVITKDFVDKHILKPSPFFKSHFVTTDLNNSLNFEIEDGKIKAPMESISILMEETAYNEDYKPYKIFITEKPLCCSNKDKDEQGCNSNLRETEKLSLNKCSAFLLSFPECLEVIKLLDTRISIFNSSYMVLPEYLQDAAIKLQSMINWAVSEFLQFLSYRPVIDYSKNDISAAIENYTMFHVHDKVFPVVKKSCLEEDKKLTQKLLTLYESHVTPDQLGVQEAFCCQTPSAIVELASLNSRGSPAEKLNCLLSTLEVLNQDVESFLLETCYLVRNRDALCLTSDDLIPLLAYVIVQSRPQYFISNLQYVQNFCWENSPAHKLSFGLVTFQAAKEFLMSNEFEFLKPSSRKMKKELSLEELMEVTVEMQNNSKQSVETKPNKLQSPTDHLLENVTKMIEASTRDLREWTIGKESGSCKDNKVASEKQVENVGDFLSSLRQKSLGLNYGKQS